MVDLKSLDFQLLVKECDKMGIKVEKGDTRLILLEKINSKPKKRK